MTGGILVAIAAMLLVTAALGAIYVYMQSETSPYAPQLHNYLEDDQPAAADHESARAA